MKELIKKLRKYEIRIRKEVNSHLQGNLRSIFKGTGIEFDDVRPYQYGDDIRTINWKVTAKGHGTYIKTFREEKEQTVFFLLDVSGSQEIGSKNKKIDIAKEICAVLALSANKDASQTGLLCFSDQKETYIKPKKGHKHTYEIISKLFSLNPKSLKTSLTKGLGLINQLITRRSIVIIISDFIDDGYEKQLKFLAQKHDLILIQINDKRETNFPKLGIIPVKDKETGKSFWINSSSKAFGNSLSEKIIEKKDLLDEICKKQNVSYLSLQTDDDYVTKLIRFFKMRNRK